MILVPPQIIPFEFGEKPINAGDMSMITCAISRGDFPINITWQLNHKPIRSDDGILIEYRKKASVLTIDDAEAIHSGEYTCNASNSAGFASYSSVLAINGFNFTLIFSISVVGY